MKSAQSNIEMCTAAKTRHAMFERRLRVLLAKPYRTEDEETEIRDIKKQKLYLKDIMEAIKEELKKGAST